MIPGALTALTVVILSNRADWWPRAGWFSFFGALGWSFGGSISYMQVIGYTHSGHSGSVLYGFAGLFVIGFLWAAMGGAGTALPAVLNREALAEFFPPLLAVFAAWLLQDVFESWVVSIDSDFRQQSPFYWYDTDWLAALTAIVAVLLLAGLRRRWDRASSLILWMALGWWTGFVLFVLVLGWRMTPPRGDNWAGCTGMVVGMILYFARQGWRPLVFATLTSGFVGGFGFATATLFKLIEVKSGLQTNWHSVLEQTYGFINGLGVALTFWFLKSRTPRLEEECTPGWTQDFSVIFALFGITWLNLQKNPEAWVKAKSMTNPLWVLPPIAWFNLAYAAAVALAVFLLVCHRRRPLPWLPATALGKAQLLLVALLWCMVIGNFERALVSFAPQRLITEGVIFLNALLLSAVALSAGSSAGTRPDIIPADFGHLWKKAAAIGLVFTVLTVLADWGIVRAIYGDQFAGHAGKHIRFGPNATATTAQPKPGQPHP